jgi:hypothetical protein
MEMNQNQNDASIDPSKPCLPKKQKHNRGSVAYIDSRNKPVRWDDLKASIDAGYKYAMSRRIPLKDR